jgi:hypothetical protein
MLDQDGANIFHHLFPIKLDILVLPKFQLSLRLLFFKLILSLLVGDFSFDHRLCHDWIYLLFGLSSLVLLDLSFEELALLFSGTVQEVIIFIKCMVLGSELTGEDLAIGSVYFLHRTSFSLLNSITLQ